MDLVCLWRLAQLGQHLSIRRVRVVVFLASNSGLLIFIGTIPVSVASEALPARIAAALQPKLCRLLV